MKHIHFIGICGVGMSALAILWKKKGWKVTGSDSGFYPPISTHLEENKIDFYPGWHPEKIGMDSRLRGNDKKNPFGHKPNLVVVGNVASSENPEWLFVQKENIPHLSYPELIAQNLVRKNSIVCAGTYGKTTTAAMLSLILKNAGWKPAYMFGGLPAVAPMKIGAKAGSAPEFSTAANDEGGDWSVLEGDEYKTGKENPEAKFFSYRPTHLLLTGLAWDHFDMYPTEESYYAAFKKLIKMIPENGLIVASENVPLSVILNEVPKGRSEESLKQTLRDPSAPLRSGRDDKKIITYGKKSDCDYRYSDIKQTKDGLSFVISHQDTRYEILTTQFGEYMAENICGVFALAKEIGVKTEGVIKTIAKFRGIKRRLEKRGRTAAGADVFDDIAHSPLKAKSVLETLRKIYKCHCEEHVRFAQCKLRDEAIPLLKQGDRHAPLRGARDDTPKIFAVFEPNTGNRQMSAAPSYDSAFADADEVVLPRLTKIKTPPAPPLIKGGIKEGSKDAVMDGAKLAEVISKTHPIVKLIENDDELTGYLKTAAGPEDAIVFLGSHGFRGMIDEIIS